MTIPVRPLGPHIVAASLCAGMVAALIGALTDQWIVGTMIAGLGLSLWNLWDRGRRVQAALFQAAWDQFERENVAWRIRNLPPGEDRAEGFRRLARWLREAGIDTAKPLDQVLLEEHASGKALGGPPPTSVAPGLAGTEPEAPHMLPGDEAAGSGSEPRPLGALCTQESDDVESPKGMTLLEAARQAAWKDDVCRCEECEALRSESDILAVLPIVHLKDKDDPPAEVTRGRP